MSAVVKWLCVQHFKSRNIQIWWPNWVDLVDESCSLMHNSQTHSQNEVYLYFIAICAYFMLYIYIIASDSITNLIYA